MVWVGFPLPVHWVWYLSIRLVFFLSCLEKSGSVLVRDLLKAPL